MIRYVMTFSERYLVRNNVFVPIQMETFNYSDGDETEKNLLEIMERVSDLSVGSDELEKNILDWPTNYHLSPKRADLLRPIKDQLKGKKILEIGAGCGAVTRYLGELGCEVVAVEGSYNRARITRERCRDLQNVQVVCDNVEDFVSEQTFDFVTFIGVLEYSNIYIHKDDPSQAILSIAKNYLSANGTLITAIENKLGLKYWAGAPEDHVDKPYFGIENKYNVGSVITFGKKELIEKLNRAGFPSNVFLFPFPDYKFPEVVLTEKGLLNKKRFNIPDLLFEKIDYFQGSYYVNQFSTSLTTETIVENDLLADLSNSFLILSSVQQLNQINEDTLAFTYSTNRKRFYAKENIFKTNADDKIVVEKRNIYSLPQPDLQVIQNRIHNEDYIYGQLLVTPLLKIVSQKGWSVEALKQWALQYYEVLYGISLNKDNDLFIDGSYLDLTPFNIIIDKENNSHFFDLEWIASFELPLKFIFFRSLVYTLGRIAFFEEPSDTSTINIIDLVVRVINEILPFNKDDLNNCKQIEYYLFKDISFHQFNVFAFNNISIRNVSVDDKVQILFKNNNILLHELANKSLEFYQLREYVISLKSDFQSSLERQTHHNSEVAMRLNEYGHQLQLITGSLTQLEKMYEQQYRDKEQLASVLSSVQEKFTSFEKLLANEYIMSPKIESLEKNMEKQRNELAWYKKTYEERTLLGIIKDRLFKKR